MANVVYQRGDHLLAQNPLLDSIQNAFSTGPTVTEIVALVAGAVLLLTLILLAARFYANRGDRDSEPAVDYLTVAVDLLGLSEADRRLLRNIAASSESRQPAAMLLSPDNLARAASPLLQAESDHAGRKHVEDLCKRLFDVPLPTPGRQPSRNL